MKKINLLLCLLLTLGMFQSALSAPLMGRESDGEEGFKEWTWDDGYYEPAIRREKQVFFYSNNHVHNNFGNMARGTYYRNNEHNALSPLGGINECEFIGPLEEKELQCYGQQGNKIDNDFRLSRHILYQVFKNDEKMTLDRINLWKEVLNSVIKSIKPNQTDSSRFVDVYVEQSESIFRDLNVNNLCITMAEYKKLPDYNPILFQCEAISRHLGHDLDSYGRSLRQEEMLMAFFDLDKIKNFYKDIIRYPEFGNTTLINKRKERIKQAVAFIKKLGYDKETLDSFAPLTYSVIRDEFNK